MINAEENPEEIETDQQQAKASLNELDQIMKMSGAAKTQEELKLEYTESQLDTFRNKQDAPLDDKGILDNPLLNHLTQNHKPMALMNTLKQKEQGSFDIEERSVQRKDSVIIAGGNLWFTEVLINKTKVGEGVSQNKKMSAHYAALNMFSNIFPKGTTWNNVKDFITSQKKPLHEL